MVAPNHTWVDDDGGASVFCRRCHQRLHLGGSHNVLQACQPYRAEVNPFENPVEVFRRERRISPPVWDVSLAQQEVNERSALLGEALLTAREILAETGGHGFAQGRSGVSLAMNAMTGSEYRYEVRLMVGPAENGGRDGQDMAGDSPEPIPDERVNF